MTDLEEIFEKAMKKKNLSKKDLIDALIFLQQDGDTESAHVKADNLLIEFINDDGIKEAYDAIDKWYA